MPGYILGRTGSPRRAVGFADREQHAGPGELITYSGDGHLITFSPTGTGKTSGLWSAKIPFARQFAVT